MFYFRSRTWPRKNCYRKTNAWWNTHSVAGYDSALT